MAEDGVRFIRMHGRVIPIKASSGAGHAAGKVAGKAIGHASTAVGVARPLAAVATLAKTREPKRGAAGATIHSAAQRIMRKAAPIKANLGLKYGSMVLSGAEGVVSGLGIGAGMKGFLASTGASLGLEATTVAMGAAAYAGRGRTRGRVKAIAKQEAINQGIGWGAYGATILANPAGRAAVMSWGKKAIGFGSKILKAGAR